MKGVVFSFKNSETGFRKANRLRLSDLRYGIKRYGIKLMFVLFLLMGLVYGSVYAKNADTEMLNSLDFLFTTNLETRLSQNFLETFCACFASDFIFLFTVFLLGFAPWGIPVIVFAMMFKGFGTGLTAGYLCLTGSLKGLGFYLLVLLPGTFLFCISFILFSSSAFNFSKKMFLNVVSKEKAVQLKRQASLVFCSRMMSSLIMTFCAALLDSALWTLFAGAFSF